MWFIKLPVQQSHLISYTCKFSSLFPNYNANPLQLGSLRISTKLQLYSHVGNYSTQT